MKNEKRISKILDDLYKIDPEFKKHEEKISKIISELLLLQPDIKPDAKFAEDLRSMLKLEVKKTSKKTSSKENKEEDKIERENKNYFLSVNFMMDLSRSFVIVAVLLLLVVSLSFSKLQTKSLQISKSNLQNEYFKSLGESKIVKLGKNSFGSLSFQGSEASLESDAFGMKSSFKSYGLGGNMGSDSVVDSSDMAISSEEMYIMPMPVKYNYIYNGGDFEMFDSEEEVYKRTIPPLSRDMASAFVGRDFSIINLNKFNNINVSNLSLIEDRDYGYSIYFGLEDGSFSLYKNWKRWPRIETICGSWENYECFENYRLSFSDVLRDQEVLQISNDFLRSYGIDISKYGEPQIQNDWLKDYSLAADKSFYYIPESINIIYPLLINGKKVYEEYGNFSGLSVEVDIRERKVAGLYGLSYQQYESSIYETESDKNKILDLVYNGGDSYNYDYFDGETDFEHETIDIELGTPSLELVKIWNYDNINMISHELYVPAYVFPIISESKSSYFYKKNIVIPAVRDFFNRYNNFDGPRILPYLMESSEGQGVSGSQEGSEGEINLMIE